MFNDLKAALVRRGIKPCSGIRDALQCSDKTARNKLSGITEFTVSEAATIIEKCLEPSLFIGEDITVDHLFCARANTPHQKL